MTWDLRPSRVACKCGFAAHCSVALVLVAERHALVNVALWSRGWLRLSGSWTCPVCVAKVATVAGGGVIEGAVIERAAARRIAVNIKGDR